MSSDLRLKTVIRWNKKIQLSRWMIEQRFDDGDEWISCLLRWSLTRWAFGLHFIQSSTMTRPAFYRSIYFRHIVWQTINQLASQRLFRRLTIHDSNEKFSPDSLDLFFPLLPSQSDSICISVRGKTSSFRNWRDRSLESASINDKKLQMMNAGALAFDYHLSQEIRNDDSDATLMVLYDVSGNRSKWANKSLKLLQYWQSLRTSRFDGVYSWNVQILSLEGWKGVYFHFVAASILESNHRLVSTSTSHCHSRLSVLRMTTSLHRYVAVRFIDLTRTSWA